MQKCSGNNRYPFLFSIDVEDLLMRFPKEQVPDFPSHVPDLMDQLLGVIEDAGAKITCFTCGDLARKYPRIIKRIEQGGHEVACHSDLHIPLDKLTPDLFRDDLKNNLQALRDAGITTPIVGFRAPIFSLTEKTKWGYEVLEELGFLYSSSVLPAPNPQYGWPEFGSEIKKVGAIYELPMTLGTFYGLKVPMFGGMYMRWLPYGKMKRAILNHLKSGPVLGFIHPYDLDTKQEYFKHPGINNLVFHALLFYKRSRTLPRVQDLFKHSISTTTYSDYVAFLAQNNYLN